MLFPEIRDGWKALRSGFGSDLVTLDLKQNNFGFDTQLTLEQAKLRRLRGALDGYGPSWSGENVTNATALNHSVVWACRRIISESVAMMPLALMQERDGEKSPAKTHPIYTALHEETNAEMTAMEYRETATDHVVAGGNAFSRIMRRQGNAQTAMELWPIMPGAVTIDRNSARQLVYVVKEGNEQAKSYTVEPDKPQEILHIRGLGADGVQGYSVITMARQSIGTGISADKYAAKFYAAGGRVPYTIELAQKFKHDQDFQRWRADWNTFYGNSDNWHQAAVLEPGMTYKQIGLSPEDSQFLETRQFQIPEICRWFLLSPDLVGDLSRATFSNIEHLALRFVKMTLSAWIVRWEQALRRCVLTPEEKKQGYFFRHNVNGLLRGDFASRMSGYATMLQNGIASINEVRDLEDWNPVEGGDEHRVQLNMTTVTQVDSSSIALGKPAGGNNGNQKN